jgi:hypothetical protein
VICADCKRAGGAGVALSLEFGLVLDDACYGLRLNDEQELRERVTKSATALHFAEIRASRDMAVPL